MPYVATACDISVLLVVVCYLDSVEYTLGCDYLIRTHNEEHIFRCEYAVSGKDIEYRMLREEGFCEVYEVGYDAVVSVCPEGSKLEAVACLFLLCLLRACVFDVVEARCIGVILGIRTIGDNEYLCEFIESGCRPEAVSLVSVYLVKRLSDWYTTAFELDVDKGKTVDEDCYVVAVVVLRSIIG